MLFYIKEVICHLIERITKTLSDVWLFAILFFAGGSLRELILSRDLWIQVTIPFWKDSNFAMSIVLASIFYVIVYKADRQNAFGWFLFYDATFQMTNIGISPVDLTTIMIFLASFFVFYFNQMKPKKIMVLVLGWSIITMIVTLIGNEFPLQILWITCLVSVIE